MSEGEKEEIDQERLKQRQDKSKNSSINMNELFESDSMKRIGKGKEPNFGSDKNEVESKELD